MASGSPTSVEPDRAPPEAGTAASEEAAVMMIRLSNPDNAVYFTSGDIASVLATLVSKEQKSKEHIAVPQYARG